MLPRRSRSWDPPTGSWRSGLSTSAASSGLLRLKASDYAVPLVPEPSWAALFRHCYVVAPRFDADVGDWRAFARQELNATTQVEAGLLVEGGRGWPVYAGDSFDLWQLREPSAFRVASTRGLQMMASDAPARHSGGGSSQQRRARIPIPCLAQGTHPFPRCHEPDKLADRNLLPRAAKSLCTNKAPALTFVRGDERAQAYVLGVLCSLPLTGWRGGGGDEPQLLHP